MNRVFVVFLTVFLIMMSKAQAEEYPAESVCRVMQYTSDFGWEYKNNGRSIAFTRMSVQKILEKNFPENPELVSQGVEAAVMGYTLNKEGYTKMISGLAVYENCVK